MIAFLKKFSLPLIVLTSILLAQISPVFALTENRYATSHITGGASNPDNANGSADDIWAGDTNTNSSWTSRWAMDDPSGTITSTQIIRAFARKGSNSGTPTLAVNLYENGTLVQTIISATDVTSTTGQNIGGIFDASAITNQNDVEVEVVVNGVGGSPSTRNSAQIDYIEWVVEYDASSAPTVTTNFATPGFNSSNTHGTKTGGTNATEHGFAYSTDSTLATGVSTTTLGALNGNYSFSQYITGLSPNQTYYYRAYATNGSGTGFGLTKSFTTGNSLASRGVRLFGTIKFKSGKMKLLRQGG